MKWDDVGLALIGVLFGMGGTIFVLGQSVSELKGQVSAFIHYLSKLDEISKEFAIVKEHFHKTKTDVDEAHKAIRRLKSEKQNGEYI